MKEQDILHNQNKLIIIISANIPTNEALKDFQNELLQKFFKSINKKMVSTE